MDFATNQPQQLGSIAAGRGHYQEQPAKAYAHASQQASLNGPAPGQAASALGLAVQQLVDLEARLMGSIDTLGAIAQRTGLPQYPTGQRDSPMNAPRDGLEGELGRIDLVLRQLSARADQLNALVDQFRLLA